MADFAASVLAQPIDSALKYIGALIKRQCIYLFCFSRNIIALTDEVKKLDEAIQGLQLQVNAANNNLEDTHPQVTSWLRESNNLKEETEDILDKARIVESGCLRVAPRFTLSKRAKKTTEAMAQHREKCSFKSISVPPPSAASQAIPLGLTYEFDSRKKIEEDIMATLRGTDVNTIGICGMGGLGKTVMVKRIANRALEEHLFDEIAITVVSQQIDELKIQLEIGGSLGLKDLKEETPQARVQKLHARLTGAKRILLVVDDVWKSLALEELGIPCESGSKGCTILLTSRNKDVLAEMNVGVIRGLEILSEEEAWFLFKQKAGTCVDDNRLNPIAKQVVQECEGLPIALATLGAALKGKSVSIWANARRQLKNSNPVDVPSVIEKVYQPLRLSYDLLGSDDAQSLFLLCSLFPEDYNIPVEYLTYFCIGLRIFKDEMRNLEEARNKMSALIEMLISRFLLLEGKNNYTSIDFVRMHDVVRDVCIFIAKQKGHIDGKGRNWISSIQLAQEKTSTVTQFPKLNLLVLMRNTGAMEEFKFDSVEGMRELCVLSIEDYYSWTSLSFAYTIGPLKNLRTLVLVSCKRLETISFVGDLVNLEILICRDCYWIKELPPQISGLNHLKSLDISGCENLQSIGRGIISSLVGLEELKMSRSFDKWESENSKERQNAGLRELEQLANLSWLEIDIVDPALAAETLHLPSKMERFDIRIPARLDGKILSDNNKKIHLRLEEGTCLGHWIEKTLLRDTEYLYLIGSGANILGLSKCPNIQILELGECKTIKNIATTSTDDGLAFPALIHLNLFSLLELEEIWDGPISSNSFLNLKGLDLQDLPSLKQFWKGNYVSLFSNLSSIDISGCPLLQNLGQLSMTGKDCLSQLQYLRISECQMLKQVFLWNEVEKNKKSSSNVKNRHVTKILPKLEAVELRALPNLTTFYQGIERIEFPLLTDMLIEKCPEMRSIISTANLGDVHHHSSHLFCQPQKVSFGSSLKIIETSDLNPFCGHEIHVSLYKGLEELSISKCRGNMSLFTSSIVVNLVSLKKLSIRRCDEMIRVINDDDEEKSGSGGERPLLVFPKLLELELKELRKLVTFCKWECDVELPLLRRVLIETCPNMKCFTLGSLTTPNLEKIEIESKRFGLTKGIDGALQEYLAMAGEKPRGGEEQEIEEEPDS